MCNTLLVITGSIAAYKGPSLCQMLQKENNCVRVILTRAAEDIITALALKSVCDDEVYLNEEISREKRPMLHIDLAKWADKIIIAPASANIISRLACGLADDLITSTYLATTAKIFIAPAMNMHMWQHPATQHNIEILRSRNHQIITPAEGLQACGDNGPGRLEDLKAITNIVCNIDAKATPQVNSTGSLRGVNIMINAGPTREAIDCMRFLSNRSSGKMGYALAIAAKKAGARVTLISGPCTETAPAGIKTINIISAEDMLKQCRQHASYNDVFIACAAISDYKPKTGSKNKLKKSLLDKSLTLKLVKNTDIVASIASENPEMICVGFAAESDDLEKNAIAKLSNKKLCAIIANPVSSNSGAESDLQSAILINKKQQTFLFDKQNKVSLASAIIAELIKQEIIHSQPTHKKIPQTNIA